MDFWEWLRQQLKNPQQVGQEPNPTIELLKTPLFQDTIFPLIGGRPNAIVNTPMPEGMHGAAFPVGRWVAFPRPGGGDPKPDIGAALHESGHIGDFRNTIPELDAITEMYFPIQQKRNPREYSASNKREYQASVFTFAVDNIRRGNNTAGMTSVETAFKELQLAIRDREEILPGTGAATYALLRQPVFAQTPLGAYYRQQMARPMRGPTAQ